MRSDRPVAESQARYDALMADHRGIVLKVARTYAFRLDDQLDLAQEIRLQVWRAFPRVDPTRPFATWLYRIALNTAISWTRRARPAVLSLEDADDPAAPSGRSDDAHTLYRLIDQLDDLNRAVLLLYLEDLTHAEIGEVLGISAANAATKVSRLKKWLKEQAHGY